MDGIPGRLDKYSNFLMPVISMDDREIMYDVSRKLDKAYGVLLELHDRTESRNSEDKAANRRPILPFQGHGTGVEAAESTEDRRWTISEVNDNSRCLESFFARDRIHPSVNVLKPMGINKHVLLRLLSWSTESSSATLWIEGPYTPTHDSQNRMTSIGLQMMKFAGESQLSHPLLSYFCELNPARSRRLREEPEMGALTALLYALIRQLLEKVPLPFEKDIDLTENRFQRLDGTKGAWKDALLLLEELVGCITQPVFCIIEGLQRLDDVSTHKALTKLIKVLRRDHLCVLYITSGITKSLNNNIFGDETLGERYFSAGTFNAELGMQGQKFWRKV